MRASFHTGTYVSGSGEFLLPDGKCILPSILALDSKHFAEYLLDQAGVVVTPGEMFQADQFVRLSYATSMRQLEEAVALVRAALSKLELPEK